MRGPPGYLRDPYLRKLDVRVVERVALPDGTGVVLDDTILYPGGGGQPEDRGTLMGVPVVGLERQAGRVLHLVDAPLPGEVGELRLDWGRRFDHMQQHTAQHLLTAVAADRFSWPTTAFHLGEAVSDIELDTPSIDPADLVRLEAAVAEEVRAARPVRTRWVEVEEYGSMDVRSRGLPPDHTGDVRLVDIEGIDLAACGGTHVASTAEIDALTLLGTESMRGGTRLRWVAGSRVRDRLREHEARNLELRSLLGTADEELVPAVGGIQEQLRNARRRVRSLEQRLAEREAERLVRWDGPVADAHFEESDPGFVQTVARAFANDSRAGARVALLTSTGEKGHFFVVAAGPEAGIDLGAVGPRVAEALGGRGGGSGPFFQGKAEGLGGRDVALEVLGS